MAASLDNPVYTVYVIDGNNKYNITPAVNSLDFSNPQRQLAQSVSIIATNIKTATGKTICDITDVRKRVFIYADDGATKDEVFRGWIWTKYHKTDVDSTQVTLKCYDNLIYLQESDDSLYFSKGKNTKSVISSICDKWGIKLNYSYSTITHAKLVLKGTLSNIIMSDILDLVKNRTGKKYVITSQKDVMNVAPEATNKTIYNITKKNNAVETRWEKSMDGMITKVQILGSADKDTEKVPVVATVKGDTAKYGTLQKLQTQGSEDSLSEAKKEANATIKEHGKPAVEYNVIATDIPWIKKGDMVYVEAGHITGKNLIVKGIERDISNKRKTMTLTLQTP